MLVGDESLDRLVGRWGRAASGLGFLEPLDLLPRASPPVRLQPRSLPGDWSIERIGAGLGGWFSVVRVHRVGGTRIEARHLVDPSVVQATVMVDTQGLIVEEGVPEAWDLLPSLLPLRPIGDTALSLLHRGDDTGAHLIQLPPKDAFASYAGGVEEFELAVTVLADFRSVAVQSGRRGGMFAVWDAIAGARAAEVQVHAAYPMLFTSALTPSGTLWAASGDTLFEFDVTSWEVRFSARLRRERTGCYVAWMSSVNDGATVIIGWNRRVWMSSVHAAPSAGEVLALDTHHKTVKRLVRLPTWTSHAVFRREHDDVVAETWGNPNEFWQGAVRSVPHPLFEPRSEGDPNWMTGWHWRPR